MIYQITILTSLTVYVLVRTKVFPDYAPHIVVSGRDIGAYAGLVLIFALIWFVVWFSERSTGRPPWLQRMRYRQGASLYLDWAILAVSLVFLALATGAGTLSFYLVAGVLCALAAVFESVWLRAEPTLPPGVNLGDVIAPDSTEPPRT